MVINTKRLSVHRLLIKDDIREILDQYRDTPDSPEDHQKKLLETFKSKAKGKAQNAPLDTIANLLSDNKANVAIVQKPVQDPDFFAEYNLYYSRQFQRVSQFCTRVHFFCYSGNIDIWSELDAIHVIDILHNEKARYLGFVTLRPIRFTPVGATILSPGVGNYVTCRDNFEVHLAGKTFSVSGTPFMQQDNAVCACAQTAIWVALRTVRRKDEHRLHTPGHINAAAIDTSYSTTRILPNREGLNVAQMAEILRSFGYSTHVMDLNKPYQVFNETAVTGCVDSDNSTNIRRVKGRIHSYIESAIPVILVLEKAGSHYQHAVTIVGHGPLRQTAILDDLATAKVRVNGLADNDTSTLFVFNSVHWVENFIVQNDGVGPYSNLPFKSDEGNKDQYSFEEAKYAIPLLPQDVFMTAEEAEIAAINLMVQLVKATGKYVIRVYLCSRHEFREWATSDQNLSDKAKNYYRATTLPRRLWIAEFSEPESYHDTNQSNFRRVGEVVLDASADHHDAPFLLARFMLNDGKGVIYQRELDNDTGYEIIKIDYIDQEKYCSPFSRG